MNSNTITDTIRTLHKSRTFFRSDQWHSSQKRPGLVTLGQLVELTSKLCNHGSTTIGKSQIADPDRVILRNVVMARLRCSRKMQISRTKCSKTAKRVQETNEHKRRNLSISEECREDPSARIMAKETRDAEKPPQRN